MNSLLNWNVLQTFNKTKSNPDKGANTLKTQCKSSSLHRQIARSVADRDLVDVAACAEPAAPPSPCWRGGDAGSWRGLEVGWQGKRGRLGRECLQNKGMQETEVKSIQISLSNSLQLDGLDSRFYKHFFLFKQTYVGIGAITVASRPSMH